jgi:uncharacterized protein
MRRTEQEITDVRDLEAVLKRARICRIGLAEDNMPYVVPVCFGYKDDRLYVHSSPKGKKIDMISKNNRVCFEAETDVELVPADDPCDFTITYRSVIGFGRACLVEDRDEKIRALNIIMEHYTNRENYTFPDSIVAVTAVIEIRIERMTGKRSKHPI